MGAPSLPGPVPGVEDAGARREPTDINPATWEWSVRLFTMMRRILRVNVKLHEADGLVDDGQIFLFNHFARFETFIPQYLIYMENGAYCRSVASREFFEGDDAFSNYLLNLGAVPNDYHRLLPFLAEEVLRGRKIIAFPEGGMVKDRRVIDEHGEFSVYSRLARERRKHHSGAAVLALYLDAFKALLRDAEGAEGGRLLQAWSERLRMEPEALKAAVALPTLVVPANITFYPIRVSDNLLRKGAAVLRRGLSRRLSEELLIEGNILLKDTDMDIRLGPAVNPARMWRWWERSLRDHVLGSVGSMEHLFGLSPDRGHLGERVLARSLRRKSLALRDESMERMYRAVSVNLSHLAAQLIVELVARGERHVERSRFHSMLYLAVKKVQRERGLNLHRSLLNPEAYGCLPDGRCAGLEQLLRNAGRAGLLEVDDAGYRFLDKLLDEHAFDEVRIENLVEVYANESAPARGVRRAARRAVAEAGRLDPRGLARLRFDDELRAYEWDRGRFRRSRYAEINAQETATGMRAPTCTCPASPGAWAWCWCTGSWHPRPSFAPSGIDSRPGDIRCSESASRVMAPRRGICASEAGRTGWRPSGMA